MNPNLWGLFMQRDLNWRHCSPWCLTPLCGQSEELSKWPRQWLTRCRRRSWGKPHGSVWSASCKSRCRPSADRWAAGESPRSSTCRIGSEPPSSPAGVYSSCPKTEAAPPAGTRWGSGVVNVADRCRFTRLMERRLLGSPCASCAPQRCAPLSAEKSKPTRRAGPGFWGALGQWFPTKGSQDK